MTRSRFRQSWLPGILTVLIGLLVNLAPLALGSNRLLPWAYNSLLAGGLLVMTVGWSLTVSQSERRVTLQRIAGPLILIGTVLAWAMLQIAPSVTDSLANPVWSVANEAVPSIAGQSISINPDNSLVSVMRLTTYVSVFLCVFLLAGKPERAHIMLWFFVCSAGLYAVYGLTRHAADWDKILWFSSSGDRVTGPFLNRNNAATYFGFGLVCALVLMFGTAGRTEPVGRNSSTRIRMLAFAELLAGRTGLLLVIGIALVVALMLTASRAGIVSAFAGCLTLATIKMLKRRNGQAGLHRFTALAVISILFVAALELSGSNVSARLLAGDLDSGGRFEVYRMTLTAIGNNFWMGTGLGTFQDAFPVFRDDILTYGLIWDKAHNDYLELVLGLGVPAAGLFLLGIAILIAGTVRGYFTRRRDSIYCCVAVSVSVIAIAHSLLDFSMQIQAVAMAYSMLLALGVAQSRSSRKHNSD